VQELTGAAQETEELNLAAIDLSDPVQLAAGSAGAEEKASTSATGLEQPPTPSGDVLKIADPVKQTEEKVESAEAPKAKPQVESKPVKAKRPSRRKPRRRPRSRPAPKAKPSKPLLNMLSRQDISKVMKRANSRLKRCAESDQNLTGTTVVVSVRIASSGKVASADPSTPRLVRSPQRGCVLKVIKGLKFPPFSGEMPAMPLPIKL
jgi:hypothetical protein